MATAPKAFGFGMRALKNFPELIPLATIISAACVGAGAFVCYALATKPDVVINKSDLPPWQRVQPTESRKFHVVKPGVYRMDPEVEALRKEIGSFKA